MPRYVYIDKNIIKLGDECGEGKFPIGNDHVYIFKTKDKMFLVINGNYILDKMSTKTNVCSIYGPYSGFTLDNFSFDNFRPENLISVPDISKSLETPLNKSKQEKRALRKAFWAKQLSECNSNKKTKLYLDIGPKTWSLKVGKKAPEEEHDFVLYSIIKEAREKSTLYLFVPDNVRMCFLILDRKFICDFSVQNYERGVLYGPFEVKEGEFYSSRNLFVHKKIDIYPTKNKIVSSLHKELDSIGYNNKRKEYPSLIVKYKKEREINIRNFWDDLLHKLD
jgi:hypothetical protein